MVQNAAMARAIIHLSRALVWVAKPAIVRVTYAASQAIWIVGPFLSEDQIVSIDERMTLSLLYAAVRLRSGSSWILPAEPLYCRRPSGTDALPCLRNPCLVDQRAPHRHPTNARDIIPTDNRAGHHHPNPSDPGSPSDCRAIVRDRHPPCLARDCHNTVFCVASSPSRLPEQTCIRRTRSCLNNNGP